jgi:hypothetical protein
MLHRNSAHRNSKSLRREPRTRFTVEHNVLIDELPTHTNGITAIVEWHTDGVEERGTVFLIVWNGCRVPAESIVDALNEGAI